MYAGSVTIPTALDNSQLEKDLAGLKKKIEKTERNIADFSLKRDAARKKSLDSLGVLDAEKAKLQEVKDRLADIRAMSRDKSLSAAVREDARELIPSVQQELADQRERVRGLQSEWNRVCGEAERYDQKLKDAEATLARQTEGAGFLLQKINKADQTRADVARNAEVADQRIVDLNRELLELKERQAQLEQSGIGLGYQEYDQNAGRITAITRELKEYQKALSKTGDGAEQPINRTTLAMEKLNSIIGKLAPELGKKTASITSQILPVLEKIAPELLSKVTPAIEAAGTAIAGIAPELAIVLAVAKVAGAAVKKVFEEMAKTARAFWDTMQGAWAVLKKTGSALAGGFSKAVAAAKKFSMASVAAFAKAAKSAGKVFVQFNAFTKLSEMLGGVFKRLGQMIRRVFVFSVITSGLRAIRTQVSAYLQLNTQFTTAMRQLKGVLLTAFQPIYDVVVPALVTLINVLSRVIATITQFFAVLFGTTAKKAQENAKALYGQSKALKETGSAAEEAAGSLAAFDEINTIETEKGGGGGGGADADMGPLFDWEYDDTPFDSWGEAFSAFLDKLLDGLPKLEEAFKKFADWLNDLAKKLYDMFTFPGVLDKVKQLGKGLAEALNKLVNWIDWEMLGRALGAGLNLALNFLTSFLYAFDWMNLGRKLAEFVNGLVSEIDWYEFGRLLWAGFKIALETLAGFILGLDMPLMAEAASNTALGFFDEMKNTIDRIPWYEIGAQIARFLNNIKWYEVISSALTAISAAIEAVFTMIKGFVETLQWNDIARQIYRAINDSMGLVDWRGIGQTLGDAFVHIFEFVRQIVVGIDWHLIGQNIADFILGFDFVGALSGLAQLIAAGINAAVRLVCGFLDSVEPEVRRIAEDLAEELRKAVKAVDWTALGTVIGRGIKSALALVSGLLDPSLFYAVGREIGNFLVGLDWVGIVGGLAEVLARAIGAAVAAVKGFLDSVQPNLKAIADGIAEKIDQFVRNVDWAELGRTISRGIEAALDFVIELVQQIDWDAIGEAIADLFTNIDWNTLLTKWSRLFGELLNAKMLALDISAITDVGINIIAGLWNGMWAEFNASGGLLGMLKRKIIDGMIGKIMGWLGIHSPSTVFAEIGRNIIAGLLQGITEAWNGIVEFFREKVDGIKQALSEAWENIKSTASEKWGAIKSSLVETWGTIKESAVEKFDEIKGKISDAWENAKTATSEKWDNIKTTLSTTWDNLKTTAGTAFDNIKTAISTAWDNAKAATSEKWDNIKTTLSTTWDNLKTTASTTFDNIKTAISTAWENAKTATSTTWENIKTTLTGTWENLKTTASTKFEEIKSKILEAWEKAKSDTQTKWDGIKTDLTSKWEQIRDNAKTKFEEVRSKISEAWDNIRNDVPGKLEGIKSAIQEKWNSIVSAASTWGRDLCSNLANGISGAVSKVTSAARNVADKISDYLHFSEPDVGPLSNFHTFMPDMLELMAKGIEDNAHLAVDAASELADSLANAVSGKSVGVDMAMPDISKFNLPLVVQGAAIPANREFMAVVQSENGSEDSLARIEKMLGKMAAQMSKGQEIVIHDEIKLDGKVVARNTVRHINDMTAAAGKPVLLI